MRSATSQVARTNGGKHLTRKRLLVISGVGLLMWMVIFSIIWLVTRPIGWWTELIA